MENILIENGGNGIRIKTFLATLALSDLTLLGITSYGTVFEQDHANGHPIGTPTNGVPIPDLAVSNVKGTLPSGATDVYILCTSGACCN